MRYVGGSNNLYKPITNTAWVRARLCKLQKGFSPGTPAFSTTKTGRHDIAEILLKVALKHQKSNQSINQSIEFSIFLPNKFMQYVDLQ